MRKTNFTTLIPVAVTIFAVWGMYSLSPSQNGESPPLSLQSPTDTAEPTEPLYYEEALIDGASAISATLALTSGSFTVTSSVARLVSHATADLVLGRETEEFWEPTHPVWIVAVKASGMTIGDAVGGNAPPHLSQLSSDTTEISGVYAAWDANSAEMRSFGVLDNPAMEISLASIHAVENESITIVTATVPPPYE